MSALEGVVAGRFESPYFYFRSDSKKEYPIECTPFNEIEQPSKRLSILFKCYHEDGSFELQSLVLRCDRVASVLKKFDPELDAGNVEKKWGALPCVQINTEIECLVERFYSWLEKVPANKEFFLQTFFSKEDAGKLLQFVKDQLRTWRIESSLTWQASGIDEVELKRIQRKHFPDGSLPRTLTVLRRKKEGTGQYSILNILVHFNKSHRVKVEGEEVDVYEGLVGNGAENRVKLSVSLISRRWFAVRSTIAPSSIASAYSELFIIQRLTKARIALPKCICKHLSKTGLRFSTFWNLYKGDLSQFDFPDEESKIRIAEGMIQALKSVHEAGVVHGDIKPQQFLYNDTNVHLADFGHSSLLEYMRPRIGTPQYCFPFTEAKPQTNDRFGLGMSLWRIFKCALIKKDGTRQTYKEYRKGIDDIAKAYLYDPRSPDCQTFFVALRSRIQGNWFQEPLQNTAEHLVWSLLREREELMDEKALPFDELLQRVAALTSLPSSPKKARA